MSLYADLGLEPGATPEAIKAAHRRAAKKHHPDAGGNPADFDRIQKAGVILRDPDKRARYDHDGSTEDGPAAPDPALAILAKAFNTALERAEDLAAADLVRSIREILDAELATASMALAMTAEELRRNSDALARLSHRGGGKARRPDRHAQPARRRAGASEAAAEGARGGHQYRARDGGRLHLALRTKTDAPKQARIRPASRRALAWRFRPPPARAALGVHLT